MVGKRCNDKINKRIELLLKYGIALKKIADDEDFSLSQIYHKKVRLEVFRTVDPSPLSI